MEELEEKARNILNTLNREQKARLVTGKDYWHTEDLEEAGMRSVVMSDGPHGLRKQLGDADYTGLHPSATAVCYPSASLSACSFDPDLLKETGQALGEECQEQEVDVLLGPGINHKRTPWCGRNFEYFSEDPLLSSALASGWIRGLQEQGVMAALKHYACNSQENYRMTTDSIVDPRAFRELYTRAFEKTIEQAHPALLMTSYNKINGVYASENKELMDLARDFGFDGVMITDWGSLNDPAASFAAGTDLEMPGLSKGSDEIVLKTVSDQRLDEIALRILIMMLKASARPERMETEESRNRHLDTAQKAAEQSMVLLKNDRDLLPLKPGASVALIGDMAIHPRYQGAGSSRVNAVSVDSVYEGLKEEGVDVSFALGVEADGSTSPALLEEAAQLAASRDIAIVVIGLPEIYESEGYDRDSLSLPPGHLQLVETVRQANPDTVVLLQTGSVVELPFADKIPAILLTYLAGSRGGKAAARILSGAVNPSGHLAETWVRAREDVPVQPEDKNVYYKESVFSGYRYYNSRNIPVNFPFGHGLSYSRFDLTDLQVSVHGESVNVRVCLQNTGKKAGAQTVQIYIHPETGGKWRPAKELKAFEKVFLQPEESRCLEMDIPLQDLAYFDEKQQRWIVERGKYEVQAGFSSRDILLKESVMVEGEAPSSENEYFENRNPKEITIQEYETMLPEPVQEEGYEKEPYDQNVTIEDLRHSSRILNFLFSIVIGRVLKKEENPVNRRILETTIAQMPLRLIGMYGFSKKQIEAVVDLLNHHYIRALKKAFQ